MSDERWPALPLAEWRETYDTLHLYTQVVGKVRLACSPMENEWWQVALYVSPRGLTTSLIHHGRRAFDLEFDFLEHLLVLRTSEGRIDRLRLGGPVSDFYRAVMELLARHDLPVKIRTMPCEIPNAVPLEQDARHDTYDPAAVQRFWRILLSCDEVFTRFRARYSGKCSPVHFFWGSFDLAVTRFSGRLAPPRPGADRITRLAYDEEVSSLGFWPGGSGIDGAAFYAYTVPKPLGLERQFVRPEQAFFEPRLGEFLLRYDDVRTAEDPDALILAFAESTFAAGARLTHWPTQFTRPLEPHPMPGRVTFAAEALTGEGPIRPAVEIVPGDRQEQPAVSEGEGVE